MQSRPRRAAQAMREDRELGYGRVKNKRVHGGEPSTTATGADVMGWNVLMEQTQGIEPKAKVICESPTRYLVNRGSDPRV